MRIKRKTYFTFVLLFLCAVLFPGAYPAGAQAESGYVNPSREEIAAKLETIAREKGIPSAVLKAVAFVESGWRQWDAEGNVVGDNPDLTRPALGIMQISSYNPEDEELVENLKYDMDFNIAYGADLLNAKWNMTPVIGDNDRNKLENWYFALWAYNSWTIRNNPNDRAAEQEVPYQEAVLRKMALEYFPGCVTPVDVTRVDPELLPAGTMPTRNTVWETPEPVHYGDLDGALTEEEPSPQKMVTRIQAGDRLTTVDRIAMESWPYGSETVIIARSDDFPDALAGVPLAQRYNCPILLTSPEKLDAGVQDVLGILAPSQVIILGGEGAVSPAVEEQLAAAMPWTEQIRRIAGADRYETAALIADEFQPQGQVALATGLNFPDALSMAAAAASQGIPVLLTQKDEIPKATLQRLESQKPETVYIAGGEGVIGPAVERELQEKAGLTEEGIRRFAGEDRYATAAEIAETFAADVDMLYLTEGLTFEVPLAAGAVAACRGGGLLLVDSQGLAEDSPTGKYLRTVSSEAQVYVAGTEEEFSTELANQVETLIWNE